MKTVTERFRYINKVGWISIWETESMYICHLYDVQYYKDELSTTYDIILLFHQSIQHSDHEVDIHLPVLVLAVH